MAINRRHLLQSAAFATLAPALGITLGVPAVEQAVAQSGTGEPVSRSGDQFGVVGALAELDELVQHELLQRPAVGGGP